MVSSLSKKLGNEIFEKVELGGCPYLHHMKTVGRAQSTGTLIPSFWPALQLVRDLGHMTGPSLFTGVRPETFARIFLFDPKQSYLRCPS
jgi:hypothetical protein